MRASGAVEATRRYRGPAAPVSWFVDGIPHAANCTDPRATRTVVEFSSKHLDVDFEDVAVSPVIGAPEAVDHGIFREDDAGVLHQIEEQAVFGLRQLERLAALCRLMAQHIDR